MAETQCGVCGEIHGSLMSSSELGDLQECYQNFRRKHIVDCRALRGKKAELKKQLEKAKHTRQIYFDRWTKGCEREAALLEVLEPLIHQCQGLFEEVDTETYMDEDTKTLLLDVLKKANAALEVKAKA